MVKEYVKELGGSVFTAYDNNHNAVDVHIVESNKKFKNKSGKRVPATKDLTSYLKSEVKQEALHLLTNLCWHRLMKGKNLRHIRMIGSTITVQMIGTYGKHTFRINKIPFGRQAFALPIPQTAKKSFMIFFQ